MISGFFKEDETRIKHAWFCRINMYICDLWDREDNKEEGEICIPFEETWMRGAAAEEELEVVDEDLGGLLVWFFREVWMLFL